MPDDVSIINLLNKQIFELREDVRKLDQKIDTLLKLCYETSSEVKVLTEIKNTLRRDVDKLTEGSAVLVSEKQERIGMVKVTKAIFTFKHVLAFFVGFVFFAASQSPPELEKKLTSKENTKRYALNA